MSDQLFDRRHSPFVQYEPLLHDDHDHQKVGDYIHPAIGRNGQTKRRKKGGDRNKRKHAASDQLLSQRGRFGGVEKPRVVSDENAEKVRDEG